MNFIIILVVTIFLLEITLRIQQKLGPIYDLKFDYVTLEGLSDSVNHKPVRSNKFKLSGSSTYGEFDGYEYTLYYDSCGVRINHLRPNGKQNKKQISILFMGDSFMQGYDDKNTIPQHVWVYFKNKGLVTNIYNAAISSYSPAIYIPQSKRIIPKVNPDFVVLDIDETDLGDDVIRYNNLIIRNDKGKNIGVKSSPLLYERLNGFIKIKKQPFYFIRLIQTVYHTKIHMPSYRKRYRGDNRSIFCFSRDKTDNAYEKYRKEINIFRDNVSELAETLIELMGNKKKILFLYHPHLQHLKADSEGRYWNDFVSNTIKKVAEKYDIAFYNATDDLRLLFGGRPQDFYWKNNIHFNFIGLKLYGRLVAERLFPLIKKIKGTPFAITHLKKHNK